MRWAIVFATCTLYFLSSGWAQAPAPAAAATPVPEATPAPVQTSEPAQVPEVSVPDAVAAPAMPPKDPDPIPAAEAPPAQLTPAPVPAPETPVAAEPTPAAPPTPPETVPEPAAAVVTVESEPAPTTESGLGHPLGLLVQPEELVKLTDVLILDARKVDDFVAGHIPGAVSLPQGLLSEERDGVVNLLRPIDQLVPLLASRGVKLEKTVIIYAANQQATDLIDAARVFWVLEYLSFPRVHVLDGGYARWVAEKRPVEAGDTPPTPVPEEQVKVILRPEVIARRTDVLNLLGDGGGTLVDSRPTAFFTGQEKADYVMRAGHIPMAQSKPGAGLLQEPYFTFKPLEEIKQYLNTDADDLGQKIIVYCNSGNSASLDYLGYRILGRDNVSLYDGSMAEWSRNPGLAVVIEPTPTPAPVAAPEPAPATAPASAPDPPPAAQ